MQRKKNACQPPVWPPKHTELRSSITPHPPLLLMTTQPQLKVSLEAIPETHSSGTSEGAVYFSVAEERRKDNIRILREMFGWC